MKRIIAAAAIAVFLIAACLTDYFYIKNSYNSFTNDIAECVNALEQNNITEARARAEKLQGEWKKREKVLAIFVNHNIIDEIDTAIIQLIPYLDSKNYGLCVAQCAVIKLKLTQMREDSTANLHSIL